MILSPSRKFAFVHIMKTAGESVETAYDQIASWQDVLVGGTPYGAAIEEPYRVRFGLHKHSTALEIRDVVGEETWNSWRTFAIVRDPVARMVSSYMYLHAVAATVTWRDRAKGALGRGPRKLGWVKVLSEAPTFAAWLRHPHTRGSMLGRPQVRYLCDSDGRQIVTDILRFETLDQDWLALREDLGLGDLRLPHKNSSAHIERPNVDDADRALIKSWMEEDYRLFGY